VGFYTLAIKVVKLSLLLVLSLNVILFPRISNLITTEDHAVIRMLLQKALQFIILITLPLAVGFYFLAPQIINLLAGEGFQPSVPLVQLLSLLPLIIGLSNLFVYQVLVPFGREKKLLFTVCITCFVSLLLHLVLVQWYGEKGTAAATLLTELCMTALTASVAFRTFRFSLPLKTTWQTSVALLPLICLIFLCQQQFSNPVIILLGSAVPGMLLYGLLQFFIFRNSFVKETVDSIRWRRKLSVTNG
jgi:O-antigen/teichoic acid export membrane protein